MGEIRENLWRMDTKTRSFWGRKKCNNHKYQIHARAWRSYSKQDFARVSAPKSRGSASVQELSCAAMINPLLLCSAGRLEPQSPRWRHKAVYRQNSYQQFPDPTRLQGFLCEEVLPYRWRLVTPLYRVELTH